MTVQPNKRFIFAAPTAFEIRRRPSRPVDVATHTVAVYRAGGGAARRACRGIAEPIDERLSDDEVEQLATEVLPLMSHE